METILTTLCYIEKDEQYLMLHRTKKKDDLNIDKWLGIGGKLEPFESPEECLLREVQEETGLTLTSYQRRGIVTFCSDDYFEYMFLYTADAYTGTLFSSADCSEGELAWVAKSEVCNLPIWEGDKLFLQLLTETHEFFSLKLVYHGDTLISHRLF